MFSSSFFRARVITFTNFCSLELSGSRSCLPTLFSLAVESLIPMMFPSIISATGYDTTSAMTLPLKNGVSICA